MNKPQFSVDIRGQEKFYCLGFQLLKILNVIGPFCKTFFWYGVDVEVNGEFPFKNNLQGWIPKKIGYIEDLELLAKNTDQFLSGVFFALPVDVGPIWEREFSTEDLPFRDMEEAVLEIRAFDTSYYEIYSNDIKIMKVLSENFSVEINKNEDDD